MTGKKAEHPLRMRGFRAYRDGDILKNTFSPSSEQTQKLAVKALQAAGEFVSWCDNLDDLGVFIAQDPVHVYGRLSAEDASRFLQAHGVSLWSNETMFQMRKSGTRETYVGALVDGEVTFSNAAPQWVPIPAWLTQGPEDMSGSSVTETEDRFDI